MLVCSLDPPSTRVGEERGDRTAFALNCINLHVFAFSCLALWGIFLHFPFPTSFRGRCSREGKGGGTRCPLHPSGKGEGCISSVAQSCLTLRPHGLQHARPPCPSSTPGVYSNDAHGVGDAIQPSYPLSSPSLPVFNLSQHQVFF